MKKIIIFCIIFLIIPVNIFGLNHSDMLYENIERSRETIFVGGSGPNNFSSIQSAIIYADDGDIIFIYKGTYYENIVIDKRLIIIGEDKKDTIIDGSGVGNVVEFSANSINLQNITIQNSGKEFADSGVIIFSNNSSLTNMIVKDTNWGLYLTEFSEKIEIKDNIITNNTRGIYSFTGGKNNIVSFNTITNNIYSGIFFYATKGNIIEKNSLCNNGNGFVVDYSNNNSIIKNEIINNTYDGIILIDSSNNNIILNNSILGHYLCGIYIGENSSFNIVENNSIYFNNNGIDLEFSNSNNIYGNIIRSNEQFGISFIESSNNIVGKNMIQYGNGHGLNLIESDDNLIEENIIEYNNESGASLFWSENNIITKNKFDHNGPLHIQLRSSSFDNIIYLNNFFNNSCNVSDLGANFWDFKGKGNFWSDFEERYPDAKKIWLRGVWNTPYEIPNNDNKDHQPLIKQWPNSLSTPFNFQNKFYKFKYPLLHFLFDFFPNIISRFINLIRLN